MRVDRRAAPRAASAVVERPAPDGRRPARASSAARASPRMRSRSRSSRSRQPLQRLGARGAAGCARAGRSGRPTAAAGPWPAARRRRANSTTNTARPTAAAFEQVVLRRRRGASAGIARTGSASTTAKTSRFDGRQPGDDAAAGRRRPRTSMRYCSAAPIAPPPGRDLGERVAGELRGDHRPPAARLQRDALQRPQAGERRRPAAPPCARATPSRDALDLPPRAEHLDHARRDEVQRDRGDGEPEDRAAQAAAALLRRLLELALAALHLGRQVDVLLDRRLEAVADAAARRLRPVGHARMLPSAGAAGVIPFGRCGLPAACLASARNQ